MRLLYLPCHSILEYDEVKLFASLGHEVASIGAYINPAVPMDNLRPPLDVPMVELVKREVDALGQQGHKDTLDAAKRRIPDAILDWAEVIIVPGMEHAYLAPQWDRIKHKRVIWRTIGQSAHPNEWMMKPLRSEGLQIVRYSPKERNIPEYAGEDALIRFYKDPDEWRGWTGEDAVVTNVTQSMRFRSLADDGALQPKGYQWTSYEFWQSATRDLPTRPMGAGSESIGGVGSVTYESMQEQLRRCRAYLATGTQPASYTLGFVEALMTGIPTVSIGPDWYRILPYGPQMFEAHLLASDWSNDPEKAAVQLRKLLSDPDEAAAWSRQQRVQAIDLFGKDKIAAQWQAFLSGAPALEQERELVAA